MKPIAGLRTRVLAAAAAALTIGSLLAVPGAPAVAAPPPNPSDSQIQNAQAQKNALADQVGQLSAQVASLQTQLQQLDAQKELAEQKVAYALSKLEEAKANAAKAAEDVKAAQVQMDTAQKEFRQYIQASYMSGEVGGTTGALLTSGDPNVLLQRSALQAYQSSHQLSAIGNLQRATVGKSNADANARQAVKTQSDAATAATQAQQQAEAAVSAAQAQQQQLQQTLSDNQTQLETASATLASLNNQRAAYDAYQAEQARLAAEAAARAAAARAAAEAAARAAAQQAQQAQSGGGGGGGSYTGPPSGGSWTAARGQEAVNRAARYLGMMYAWAGGNAYGPTTGVCAGDGAWNDCHITGFDCSGLSLYAWAPYIGMAHYAATQYTQAGSYHPGANNLMPGDLLFWSSDGTISGIHHVAIYSGGGNVIQAPQSGSVIQITPLSQMGWGYFGATRPLS
jgi:cell wall-associated NlpC family hydrolase/regulator of replication initiation timing